MSEQRSRPPDDYRSLVEHAPYGIFRTSRSGEILLANPALVDILGYDSEEEVLRLDLDRDVYVDGARRERIIEEHRSGRYSDVEARWERADGEEIVVRMSGHAARDQDGDFLYFETFVEDVTDQRRTEDRLDRVLETVGAVLFVLSVEKTGDEPAPLWVSESLETVHGYPLEETWKPGWFEEHLHPDERDRVVERSDSVLEEGHVTQDFRFRNPDGSYRWFHQDMRLVEDAPGSGREVVGIWLDVTEQKEAERALQRAKDRLDRVLESAGAFVYTLVPDGDNLRFDWLSRGVESLLGYSRREALQPGWLPLGLHPEDRDRVLGMDAESFSDGKLVHEFRFRHKSGGYRWFREELRVLEDGPDGPSALVGVSVDITERKKAELDLAQAGERLRSIMNAVPDAIINIDAEGRIDDLNPAAEEVYGHPAGELIGRPFTILFPERFRAVNSQRFQELLRDGDGTGFRSVRMRGLHASGEEFSAELSVAQHTMGSAQYVTAVFRDVTEQRRLEAQREKLIEELQTALEEVRTLRGILPICSRCKKIRDEAGHWERVESYLKSHSEAELSHGICPECAQELYGEDLEDLLE